MSFQVYSKGRLTDAVRQREYEAQPLDSFGDIFRGDDDDTTEDVVSMACGDGLDVKKTDPHSYSQVEVLLERGLYSLSIIQKSVD